MAADIAGFSRLVGFDEEATLSAQRAHRSELIEPLLAEHHGRIANTAGDSFLFEFPSAVEAVRCSMAVQDGMAERNQNIAAERRIEYRIGVNVDDVMTDGDDLLGDGVNIAARLESICQPGSIVLSDDAFRQVRDRLEIAWEDGGEHEVKNIARPVKVWRWSPASSATVADTPLALPDKPSIAVLPFDNMSGDPEQEYFSDGLTEDIITGLSRLRWLFVIARNSSFAYKGEAIDVKRVGQELGVRYLLEGSVRKSGRRIRVTAQLIETASGNHIWAERYDRDLEDIFDLQDELTGAISANVDAELADSERQLSRQKSTNLDAWDYFQRGNWHLYKYSKDGMAEARQHFETAVARAPEFASPHAALAYVSAGEALFGYVADPAAVLEEGLRHGEQAVALDSRDAYSHYGLGRICTLLGDQGRAIPALERAIDINPSFAQAHYGLGFAHLWFGRAETASDFFTTAIRLSPNDPQLWTFFHLRGLASFLLGDFTAAEPDFISATQAKGDEGIIYTVMAANYGMMNKADEARTALDELRRLSPDASITRVRTRYSTLHAPYLEITISGLRKAGLREE
ncbi:MAG: tetratricopeptide repeat protein [Rhodospirillaceae bacterium]|nr:tetratricopeptide repeat protein [Rhodospirillaceae bacterium]MBT3976656.1 tetratricopeptide repeat protein [Rhodospirillaceae bacterium]